MDERDGEEIQRWRRDSDVQKRWRTEREMENRERRRREKPEPDLHPPKPSLRPQQVHSSVSEWKFILIDRFNPLTGYAHARFESQGSMEPEVND